MKTVLLIPLMLLDLVVATAGSFEFRPADGQGMRMRNPGYGMPARVPDFNQAPPQTPSYVPPTFGYTDPYTPGYYQHDLLPPDSGFGLYQGQPQPSFWDLGEPQLFEPPADLPYADRGTSVPNDPNVLPQWRGVAWPDEMPEFNQTYRPTRVEPNIYNQGNVNERFMPQNPTWRSQSVDPGQQGNVSPGRYSSWR